jgi:hypothetical protein
MTEERFTFSPRHLHLLAHVRTSLEAAGFRCTVEKTTMTRHKFELHTLVAVPPKKLHPITEQRRQRGSSASAKPRGITGTATPGGGALFPL